MKNVYILIVIAVLLGACSHQPVYHFIEGQTMGTTYHIKYKALKEENYKDKIDSVLKQVNQSMSTYIPDSKISEFNQSERGIVPDTMFLNVFKKAKIVYSESDGAFDPTVMPLVNAWGFGFEKKAEIDSGLVDSLLTLINFNAVYQKNDSIVKDDSRISLDFSAIAKGFGVDVVAGLLEHLGVSDYMVEIGGELKLKGKNPNGEPWSVGVERPNENERELNAKLSLSNIAMATSGNYRNFYYQDGKRFAHTIDPKSGYPVQHQLLSATVISASCAMSDAFATSFMVLGLERAKKVATRNELLVYFIYENENGEWAYYASPELADKLSLIQ